MVLIKRNTNNKLTVLVIILLLLSPVLCAPPSVMAQNEQPRVMIYGSPENPVAGSTWVLNVLVDHDNPNEVDVLAPPFTGSFLMEELVKGPRHINPSELWTALEYRFILHSPGTITFDAFTIITPRGQTTTVPFDVSVQGSLSEQTGTAQVYRLVWEGMPSAVGIGESAVLTLRISGRNPPVFPLEAGLLVPPVPMGHILESLPLADEEKSAGVALKLRLIPLEAVPFALNSRRISPVPGSPAVVFEIPALRITVSPAGATPSSAAAGNSAAGTARNDETPIPSFPSLETAVADHSAIFKRYQTQCEDAYGAALDLWESGRFADALAALRQTEKNHPAGRLFADIRRGAEQALGFDGTNDERRRLFKVPQFLADLFNRKSNSAVLRETAIRRIPDKTGEAVRILREGQPVLVLQRDSNRSKWLMVITNDDSRTSGWVPEENTIFY